MSKTDYQYIKANILKHLLLYKEGIPPQDWVASYKEELKQLRDEDLHDQCFIVIGASFQRRNDQYSDWHWQVSACYAESKSRPNHEDIYLKAYDRVAEQYAGT